MDKGICNNLSICISITQLLFEFYGLQQDGFWFNDTMFLNENYEDINDSNFWHNLQLGCL